MSDIIQSGLAPLFVFVIVVTFHELGHFLAARMSGVSVMVFSVGFGPELLGFNDKHGTRWRLSLIPLGGYVRMKGDENIASMPEDGTRAEQGTLQGASVWRRLFIVAAGPLASFLLAPLLFFIVAIGQGVPVEKPLVGKVIAGSAAEQAGLRAGDEILAINGHDIDDFFALSEKVQQSQGQALELEVYTQSEQLMTLKISPRFDAQTQRYLLGIQRATKGQSPVDALVTAARMSAAVYVLIPTSIAQWITGSDVAPQQVAARGNSDAQERTDSESGIAGPIGIARMASDSAQQSWASLLIFTALLSVNLGFLNLLPIPILDGGHIVFLSIEALRGRAVNAALQMKFYRVGLLLLLALFIYGTISDIIRL